MEKWGDRPRKDGQQEVICCAGCGRATGSCNCAAKTAQWVFYLDEMVYLTDSVNCSLTEMYDSNVYVEYIDSDGSLGVLLRRIAK